MTTTLADLCKLARPPAAFTTFQGHFLSSFLTVFNGGFCRCAAARVSFASWAAKRSLNLLRASSVEFNVYFLLSLKSKADLA